MIWFLIGIICGIVIYLGWFFIKKLRNKKNAESNDDIDKNDNDDLRKE